MKKILITGGAGFIGSAIIDKLLTLGHEVFVLDNLSFGKRDFIPAISDRHFYNIDILDDNLVNECISSIKPNILVHLAAIHFIPYCNAHPFESAKINIQGTRNILNACSNLKNLEKIFFASTAAVYPIIDDKISESENMNPLDIYGLSKAVGEDLIRLFYIETKVPSIICRFFNAFGPNETNPHLIPEIQAQINSGSKSLKLGNLAPKRDYIHTYDMAEAVSLLLDKFDEGIDVFNLGSGSEFSVTEIVEAFESQVGYKFEIIEDPNRMRKSDRLHLLADISKITKFINWTPRISLNEGISTLIDERLRRG
jgi:UDP-glucose 4-epimerase